MTAIKMTILATILVLTSASANALDIRGIHLGDAWDTKVMQTKLSLDGDRSRFRCYTKPTQYCAAAITVVGIEVEVYVSPKDQKVWRVEYVIQRVDFDKFVSAFVAKFGKPGYNNLTTLQNGFGAQFQNHQVAWLDGMDRLEIEKYRPLDGGKLDQEQGLVSLWLNEPTAAPKPNL